VLEGLVDRFWTVRWSLPDGTSHTQQVLTHPGANVSVATDAPPLLHGVPRRMTTRTVTGAGWAVAAMTAPGGLGALVDVPAHTLTDRVVPFASPIADLDPAAWWWRSAPRTTTSGGSPSCATRSRGSSHVATPPASRPRARWPRSRGSPRRTDRCAAWRTSPRGPG
jgi:hypothetical protein